MSEKSELSGWQRVLIIILPYLFIVAIFQFIGAFAIGLNYENTNYQKTSEQQLIIQFCSFIGTVFVVWLFMKYVDKVKFVAIGLRLKNNFSSIYLGFFIGLAIMLIGFGLLFSLDEIQYQGLDFDLKELMISILLFLLVSLTEEIIFRGYFLRNLMHSYSKYLALLITATFFALMHAFNPNVGILGLVSIFVAGIFLGITYIHTKNLWFPIALHFSWNFFQSMLGFNVSGQDTYSVISYGIQEETILNGGYFGFEGSILSIIAMIVTIVGIFMYYQKKKITISLQN